MAEFISLPDLIAGHARRTPDKPAVIQDQRVLTYAALDELVDRVAARLQMTGAPAGSSVAICAATSINYVVTFLGILRAGLAVVPLATSAAASQLQGMIRDSGARLLFLDAETAATLNTEANNLPLERIALDDSSCGHAFLQWICPPGTRPTPPPALAELPFNIIYSSGTTGLPKGIVHSHRTRFALYGLAAALGFTSASITLVSTPFYSNTTLTAVLPTLAIGGTLVLQAKFDAGRFLALAERSRTTHAMLVPAQYRRLMEHPEFDATDLSSFVCKYATSAPFPAQLKAEVVRRWPGDLIEFYGLTEGGGSSLLSAHQHPDKLHTVGQPAPGHEFRIIDENGTQVHAGEVGDIVGRSPIMSTYHKRPDATADSRWVSPEGTTFMRTGDIGRIDADGFLIIMDRRKDMIISGGFNIYPSDLEAILSQHPDVREVAVVGVPSERWGETPVAFVVAGDAALPSTNTLLRWVSERVGKTQRLSDIVWLPELPRNAIGKVLKRELRDRYGSPDDRDRKVLTNHL